MTKCVRYENSDLDDDDDADVDGGCLNEDTSVSDDITVVV